MGRIKVPKHDKDTIYNRYRFLVEQAYNFRETDSAFSDFYEYKAIKLLNKLNKLKYLEREQLPLA